MSLDDDLHDRMRTIRNQIDFWQSIMGHNRTEGEKLRIILVELQTFVEKYASRAIPASRSVEYVEQVLKQVTDRLFLLLPVEEIGFPSQAFKQEIATLMATLDDLEYLLAALMRMNRTGESFNNQ